MRLITGHGYDTPVLQLLEDADMLSINQLIHYTTLTTCFKVKKSTKPLYLAQRLGFLDAPVRRNLRKQTKTPVDFDLSTARQGYMYRAAKGWSSLPVHLKEETRERPFKKGLRKWVALNVPPLPQRQT